MRPALFTLLLFVVAGAAAHAQVHTPFAPGYVVTAAGDTLRGELAREPDLLATQRARFRPGPEAEAATYAPADLLAYGFDDGRAFERASVAPAQGLGEETLFLRLLVRGGVSLYTYALDVREGLDTQVGDRRLVGPQRYVLRDGGGVLRPLYQPVRAVLVNGEFYAVREQQYHQALTAAFAGCPAEQRRAARVAYRQRDLTAAVVRFNECVGAPVAQAAPDAARVQSDLAVALRVRAGAGATRLFHPQELHGLQGTYQPTVPYLGVMADFHFPAASRNLSAPLELALRSHRVDDEAVGERRRPEDFERLGLAGSLGLRYFTDLPGLAGGHVSVSGGILMGRLFGDRPHYRECYPHPGDPFMPCYNWQMPAWESGNYVEAGMQRGRLSAGARWENTVWGASSPLTAVTLLRRRPAEEYGVANFRASTVFGVVGWRL
jgi:hypothetical protein